MQRLVRLAFFAAALLSFVMALLPKPPSLPLHPGDKIQHMMAFVTLGALASAGWRDRRAVALFAGLALFGAAIEVFTATRTGWTGWPIWRPPPWASGWSGLCCACAEGRFVAHQHRSGCLTAR